MPPTYPPSSDKNPDEGVTSSITDPIAVPSHGPGGSFSILAKARIFAPPVNVFRAVRDTKTWPAWNSFCPACTICYEKASYPDEDKDGLLVVDSKVTLDIFMNGDGLVKGRKRSRTMDVVVSIMNDLGGLCRGQKGYKLAWTGVGYPNWQLRCERVMEFVERDGFTDYVCWETFGGLLAPIVKATCGAQLTERFGDYARDVKEYCEKGQKGEEVEKAKAEEVEKGEECAKGGEKKLCARCEGLL